jgi:hypothetical protein
MTAKTSPQHRAEPNAKTLKFWQQEQHLKDVYGIKPAILPGFGKHRAPSIMAAPETETQVAA